ncbi:indole-3-glycerol phosphate synthase TrpC [Salinibacillus xinjiangensis]|uniref:Indole-3-glycerol phosphate synthase n=1 Tax=Salinibacillus xinjiangensis TaxID=1229268 RepID=A0A6G1X963_9BACI|nr:indole-3-glycerol phosphate synthase TrpC [Salinibacillus xinjiangensis]MRG87543.1 indole-3-glycerol phosphate synthase TrpC [Salinibacillus xinjiangensis]
MTTILDRILKEKEKEVARLKKEYVDTDRGLDDQHRSLYNAFMNSNHLNVISEIKRASPSKGDIDVGVNPVEQAKQYVEAGAGAISVLTDTPFFKGTMDDLRKVREVVDVPILCKDFIIDTIQIDRAKASGADVILLIASALSQAELDQLYQYAKSKQLEVLFEVHNEEELAVAKEIGANIIGINNRDLKTFDVRLDVTEQLAGSITSPDTLIISESGFRTADDAERIVQTGARGILVGETLMRSDNLAEALANFKVSLVGERA